MNRLSTYAIFLLSFCLSGSLLLSCKNWELPGEKSQRNCTKPSGMLTVQAQQRKIDAAITGSSGTIDQVRWDFGNGSTTVTTGLTVSYTYPEPGTYAVEAALTNTCGVNNTIQQTVSVSNAVSPTVSLLPVTGISTSSAITGMTITNTGNATVTRYGICWSTNPNPTVTDKVNDKEGAGGLNVSVPFSMTGLTPNTVYYVRSFATNALATTPGYSPVQSFTTGQNPEVVTLAPSAVDVTTATVNFRVNTAGNPPAKEYGICYSSNTSLPNVENATLVPVGGPAVGISVAVNLKDLTPNKTYYYRAYTRSASGEIIYGDKVESFTTKVDTLAEDLVASVSFTDRSLLDASGNANHVRLVGNPMFTTDRIGKANSAILLDGQQDYFYMPENNSLNPAAISISIWIKPTSVVRWMQIYNKSRFSDGANEMYSSLIRPNTDSPGGVFINTDIKQNSNCQSGKGWQSFIFPGRPDLSKWHHVVMTYSGRTARMYFDNALLIKEDNLPSDQIDVCYGGDLKFGVQSRLLPNFFYGAMDDIRIYRRPLSVAEVSALFNQQP